MGEELAGHTVLQMEVTAQARFGGRTSQGRVSAEHRTWPQDKGYKLTSHLQVKKGGVGTVVGISTWNLEGERRPPDSGEGTWWSQKEAQGGVFAGPGQARDMREVEARYRWGYESWAPRERKQRIPGIYGKGSLPGKDTPRCVKEVKTEAWSFPTSPDQEEGTPPECSHRLGFLGFPSFRFLIWPQVRPAQEACKGAQQEREKDRGQRGLYHWWSQRMFTLISKHWQTQPSTYFMLWATREVHSCSINIF